MLGKLYWPYLCSITDFSFQICGHPVCKTLYHLENSLVSGYLKGNAIIVEYKNTIHLVGPEQLRHIRVPTLILFTCFALEIQRFEDRQHKEEPS